MKISPRRQHDESPQFYTPAPPWSRPKCAQPTQGLGPGPTPMQSFPPPPLPRPPFDPDRASAACSREQLNLLEKIARRQRKSIPKAYQYLFEVPLLQLGLSQPNAPFGWSSQQRFQHQFQIQTELMRLRLAGQVQEAQALETSWNLLLQEANMLGNILDKQSQPSNDTLTYLLYVLNHPIHPTYHQQSQQELILSLAMHLSQGNHWPPSAQHRPVFNGFLPIGP